MINSRYAAKTKKSRKLFPSTLRTVALLWMPWYVDADGIVNWGVFHADRNALYGLWPDAARG
jgi:hypothetical protein